MARVAVVITKKEYEQARKDRRTKLVDIAALLIGLLMLTGGVGAVWAIDPVDPVQTDWTVQWNDVDHGGKACSAPSNPKVPCPLGQIKGESNVYIVEGETQTFDVDVPATDVNISEVNIKLTWVDDIVEYEGWTGTPDKAKPAGDEVPSSWDCMTLKVTTPTGEAAEGNHCGGMNQGEGGTIGGIIEFKFAYAPKPNVTEAEGKRAEVEEQVVMAPTTGGIGNWKFEVTLDSAGDARGNKTKTACENDPDGTLCATLIAQFDSNTETSNGRTNAGNCRATQYYVCDGARTDATQEWYLHMEWTTFDLRALI